MKKEESQEAKKTSNTTRRRFIGTTTAAAAGTALSSISVATHAHAAGNDSLKVGVIGCGGRGRGATAQHLLNEGTELVAMADAYRHQLDDGLEAITKTVSKNERPGRINVSEDNKHVGLDAYRNVIDSSDTVILATPPGFRPMMFEYAVEQGKNIFMEKPVATDAEGYRRVIAAAKKADEKGLKVVCGLQRRYQDHYIQAYEEVQNGAIGQITGAQCYWNSAGVWTRPRAALAEILGREPTEMEYQIYNWYYFTWICGDHICEQHIHNIDVINWFVGSHPVKAQGMGGRQVRTGPDTGEIFDHHYVEFQHENGVFNNSQCRHQKNCFNGVAEILVGTKGRLELSNQAGALFLDRKGEVTKRIKKDTVRDPYEVEHAELVKHIRQDKPVNDAYYTADSTMTAIFGRMATYSGKELTWDEAVASKVALLPDKIAWDATPKVLPDENGRYPHAIPGVTKVI